MRYALRLPLPLLLVSALFLLAGCEGHEHHGANAEQDHAVDDHHDRGDHHDHGDHDHGDHAHGDHHDRGHHHHPGLEATAGPGYTVADVQFMQMMMGHHAQAVVMSELAAARAGSPEVRAISTRIDLSQRDEMAFMEGWLAERGQQVPTQEQMDSMVMPGLVSPENMARLAEAEGAEFDRLFLEFMIEHHIGAVDMVDDLFRHPAAAQDSELFPFAVDVAADQMDEIHIMERLLLSLPSP